MLSKMRLNMMSQSALSLKNGPNTSKHRPLYVPRHNANGNASPIRPSLS